MVDPIKIDGLSQFVNNLKKINADLPKTVRVGFNDAAQIIVDYAQPRMPHDSGRAAASVKVKSTRTAVRVSEGGNRAPYVPWLDFGGKIGRNKSIVRQFYREGRYLYAGLAAEGDQIYAAIVKALLDAVEAAGIEVD